MNLYVKSVYFHTDEAIHKKFKMICAINDVDMGKTLTQLMQNYVTENKESISSPQIQGKLPQEIPSFYGEHEDWAKYVRNAKKLEIENFATRITFLRYLLYIHLIERDNNSEKYETLNHPEYFKESEDYKFLLKNSMISTVRNMRIEKQLPPIKII